MRDPLFDVKWQAQVNNRNASEVCRLDERMVLIEDVSRAAVDISVTQLWCFLDSTLRVLSENALMLRFEYSGRGRTDFELDLWV